MSIFLRTDYQCKEYASPEVEIIRSSMNKTVHV